MDRLFKEEEERIRIIIATEEVQDPYEKNIVFTELPSLPISAIVTDLAFAKIQYAMPGIVTDKAKEIITYKKYRSLIENSYRIKIGTEYYVGWKQNSKMQIREEGNFIRVYCYIQKVSS
ncbi:hypothetical protein LCGC14_0910290 [marine sediment metagenome]|uniref:Uncharacterized protein n=1 Tax=marine sediment metagenome TaxID=412755 RepID=A0A0F9NYI1_9ZZZZ